ncbi:hypothetical protein IP78_13805 [Brevundimonas sp. AAP58]|nr:hypothetical protein IP78_13805 [Brevundimonas sp. AAP58]
MQSQLHAAGVPRRDRGEGLDESLGALSRMEGGDRTDHDRAAGTLEGAPEQRFQVQRGRQNRQGDVDAAVASDFHQMRARTERAVKSLIQNADPFGWQQVRVKHKHRQSQPFRRGEKDFLVVGPVPQNIYIQGYLDRLPCPQRDLPAVGEQDFFPHTGGTVGRDQAYRHMPCQCLAECVGQRPDAGVEAASANDANFSIQIGLLNHDLYP